ncbi:MAG: tyrosine-type recombinase/integrase [Phototrophicaceae bacterium]
MVDSQQLPLFSLEPQAVDDLDKRTPLVQTLPFFEQYLRQEGKSEHTIKAFLADIVLLGEHGGMETALQAFQTPALNAFLNWMEHERGVPCSRKTYARRVTSLKVFFKWLRSINVLGHDPAKSVVQRNQEAPLSYALTTLEIQEAIRFSQTMRRKDETDTRPQVLLKLLLETAIKKNEAMRLVVSDIHREAEEPYLHIYQTAQNVYKERKIPISQEWLARFEQYKLQYRITEKVFTCTARNLEYILSDIGEGAGLPTRLSFEVLRWTSAVQDTRQGLDAETIREKLGLSRISWVETGRKVDQLLQAQLEAERRYASPHTTQQPF